MGGGGGGERVRQGEAVREDWVDMAPANTGALLSSQLVSVWGQNGSVGSMLGSLSCVMQCRGFELHLSHW